MSFCTNKQELGTSLGKLIIIPSVLCSQLSMEVAMHAVARGLSLVFAAGWQLHWCVSTLIVSTSTTRTVPYIHVYMYHMHNVEMITSYHKTDIFSNTVTVNWHSLDCDFNCSASRATPDGQFLNPTCHYFPWQQATHHWKDTMQICWKDKMQISRDHKIQL